MSSRVSRRLIHAFVGTTLLAAPLACGRNRPEIVVKRNGEDMLVSGSSPMVRDSVPGDVIMAGGNVHFAGAAGGDYLGAGGQQRIDGHIHGSLRAAGGEIHVAASVDRNATIVGGSVSLDSAGVITRNAYMAGGSVQVNGAVQQSLLASGGSVVLNGNLGRDVEVSSGELRIGPRARIAGNLRYRVPRDRVHIDSAARITGTVTALPVSRRPGFIGLLWILGFLLAGAVVVAILPGFAAESAEIVPLRPGRAALLGLGWLILVPILVVIAAVTVIGIPLAMVMAALWCVLTYLGRAAIAIWLGRLILGARARTGRTGVLVNFLVGGVILLIVGYIPLIGPLVAIVATVLGIGAFLLRGQALRERQPA
jgi:cytoskeletal protein CcmA (bactofilin family)